MIQFSYSVQCVRECTRDYTTMNTQPGTGVPRPGDRRNVTAAGAGDVRPPVHFETVHDVPRPESGVFSHGAVDRGGALVRHLRIFQWLWCR